jgi:diphthamide synthase (EF-2-diphthine--ammonia ligase)
MTITYMSFITCGRKALPGVLDADFLAELPAGADPCGENGEFHSFVFDGLILKSSVVCSSGETVCRDGFWFCDLVPTT